MERTDTQNGSGVLAPAQTTHDRVEAVRREFRVRPASAVPDVGWVGTDLDVAEQMLDLARLTPIDHLVDLGSGDGRIVIAAATRGAHARGVELDRELIAKALAAAESAGVSDRASFAAGDLFDEDLSTATVVTLFLSSDLNARLRPKLLGLRPGTRIVSNSFSMGEWEADETAVAHGCGQYCTALLWVVPAKIAGRWESDGEVLKLEQRFQNVEGTWSRDGISTPVRGKLSGDQVRLTIGDQSFDGRVDGHFLKGRIGDREVRLKIAERQVANARDLEDLPDVVASVEAIPAGQVDAFRLAADGQSVRPTGPKLSRGRTATVVLPAISTGFTQVEDDASNVRVRFALEDVTPVPITVADGFALYPSAIWGADVLHRVSAEGTEDYVVFEQAPAREELTYSVDVSSVPGLRLVSNTLEFLDDEGTPRLRVAPPTVVDAEGRRHAATLSVEHCAYDVDAKAPWRRPITAPDAPLCTVRVRWGGVTYPIVVDPAWTTTGAMAAGRSSHAATQLESGDILVTGGEACAISGCDALATAELYDQATGTFAATGAMVEARAFNTATLIETGQVLVTGGRDCSVELGCARSKTSELYDPEVGTFALAAPMVQARAGHTATRLSTGDVLVVGPSWQIYDLELGNFTLDEDSDLYFESYLHTATELASGDILVAGGTAGGGKCGGPSRIATIDNFSSGQRSSLMLNDARTSHTATVLENGNVLFVGGLGPGESLCHQLAQSSAEILDPDTSEFLPTGSMMTERGEHTATLLPTGEVLVAGGSDCGGNPASGCTQVTPTASAELYNPASGTFSEAPPMSSPRARHTATMLDSGSVLITGGVGANGVVLASAELYGEAEDNPATGGGGAGEGGATGGTSQGGASADIPEEHDGCGCYLAAPPAPIQMGWLWPGLVALLRRRAGRRSDQEKAT